jgi:hypothetical protein
MPEIEPLQRLGEEVWFRADAVFALPDINNALEERGTKYASHLTRQKGRDLAARPSVVRC